MTSHKTNRRVGLIAALLCAATGGAHADAVIDWNDHANAAAVAACIVPGENPLHESRMYAMVHLAIHDALNAIQRRSRPYAYNAKVRANTSADAAVAAAARDVLVSQIPLSGVPPQCVTAGQTRVEVDYSAALRAIPDGTAKTQGINLGQAAAAAIIALRAHDGSDTKLVDPDFAQGTALGQWRFTPGSPPIAFAPGWGKVKPFALRDALQFQPEPPLPVRCDVQRHREDDGCQRYAADVEEVRRLGGDGIGTPTARSSDQSEIALFWMESSPAAWNRIARSVATRRRLDAWQNARLFALLNVAQADGYVASWATKFQYRFWRPITAIRAATEDGNPDTTADATWMSLRPTPPVPDYESAHAMQGAAAAEVMKHVFGHNHVLFSACSLSLPNGNRCADEAPVWRTFRSFDEAAAENGASRVYIGFHFRDAVDKGLKRGRQIGHWTTEQVLQLQRER